jgi:phage replication-related protein YjqB (UPF0714/DUF867 family)
MKDKYQSFADLKLNRPSSFTVDFKDRDYPILIFTPHGGGIEPGTTELCQWFSLHMYPYYSFTGKGQKCKELHITSTNFGEPRLLKMLNNYKWAVSFHGMSDYIKRKVGADIYIGGYHQKLIRLLKASLSENFSVVSWEEISYPKLSARSINNVTNKCISGKGVQIEISATLRKQFFHGKFDAKARKRKPSLTFGLFCRLINNAIQKYLLNYDT